MISKNQRLSRNTINFLLKKGQKIANQHFLIKFALNKGTNNRYSVVVSKKIFKLATDRNKLRRRTYDAISQIAFHQNNHFNAVIHLRHDLNQMSFLKLSENLQIILQQIDHQLNKNHG